MSQRRGLIFEGYVSLAMHKSLAFLLGFGFAVLPSFGPLIALPLFFINRWKLGRLDGLWLLAALVAGLSFGIHSGLRGLLFGTLQVLGPWLVYRAFRQLPGVPLFTSQRWFIATGIISGLSLTTALGWLQIEQLNFAYKTLNQAIIWNSPPALYGHTMLTLGGLIAVLLARSPLRFFGLTLSAFGILISGSREAALAWVFMMVALFFTKGERKLTRRIPELGLFLMVLALIAGLGAPLGWGRLGFLLDIAPNLSANINLVQGSEIANGDWWDKNHVRISSANVTLGSQDLTLYQISKNGSLGWYRLQQVIPLEAGDYSLSVWLKPEQGSEPGIQGWGQVAEGTIFSLISALGETGWKATTSGPGNILSSGILEREGDWQRVFVSFRYEGPSPLYWYVGLTPDQRTMANTRASFAGFQLERSSTPSAYRPGSATQGLSLRTARIPLWQSAWEGIQQKPLTGWGPGAFPSFYQTRLQSNQLSSVPAHSHNFYLQVLFERGLLGFLSLLFLLAALSASALIRQDMTFLVVLAGLSFANLFDVSLLYGAVIYPLAAVAGWRAVSFQNQREAASKRLLVQLSLAAMDYLMVCLAFVFSYLCHRSLSRYGLSSPASTNADYLLLLAYVFLLWPLLAWREGLYPGYGLRAAEELKKQISSAFYAMLIFTAGGLLFWSALALGRTTLLVGGFFSFLLLPIGRALSKRFLLAAKIWGEDVLILGAGKIGQGVAQALIKNPLDGLRPRAYFDDACKRGSIIQNLVVQGNLAEAQSYARQHDIQHLIVAIPDASQPLLLDILHKGRKTFKTIQFIPDLNQVPALSVRVHSLDKFLTLEMRNELHSKLNRFFKRSLDLVAVSLAAVLLSPLFLLLAILIYLDSPGAVFFGHERIGRNGKTFKAWKFRTMVPNAEALLETRLKENPALRHEWETTQKLQHDPRVTRLGQFLRKYSLDELPQLWNVLIGDMSLVGPRPIVAAEIPKYESAFELYKLVRPGMTGFWQVSGRNNTDYAYRVELDSFYVQNWSVWLDIVILAKTPLVVLKAEGAY